MQTLPRIKSQLQGLQDAESPAEISAHLQAFLTGFKTAKEELPDVYMAHMKRADTIVKKAGDSMLSKVKTMTKEPTAGRKASLEELMLHMCVVRTCLPNLLPWSVATSSDAEQVLATMTAGNVSEAFLAALAKFAPEAKGSADSKHAQDMVDATAIFLQHHSIGSEQLHCHSVAVHTALPLVCQWLADIDKDEKLWPIDKGTELLQTLLKCCKEGEETADSERLIDVLNAWSDFHNSHTHYLSQAKGENWSERAELDVGGLKIKACIQKFGVLKASDRDAVTEWKEIDIDGIEKEFFAKVTEVYKCKHDKLVELARKALQDSGLGIDEHSWHGGRNLEQITCKQMWMFAEEGLFQGIDSKKLAAGITHMNEAMKNRLADSQVHGFLIDEQVLESDVNWFGQACATKLTALLLLVLKDCWEEGPAKLVQKRGFKKLCEELVKHGCHKHVPKPLIEKIEQLKGFK